MPLTKNVNRTCLPSRSIAAAKSVRSCQRVSSVQLSNASITNCGGRATSAACSDPSENAMPAPSMATIPRNPIFPQPHKPRRHPNAGGRPRRARLTLVPRSPTRRLIHQGRIHMQQRRPVMLVVLDGWGWREEAADNAVRQAKTPTFDRLWSSCPHALLRTSGEDVGLPPGQMGNSEVGHLNIGAGRVVKQTLQRITDAVADHAIDRAPALLGLIERLRQSRGTCHLMGLVSPGGVHSHQDHAAALAHLLAEAKIPTAVHAFTDGRDTPPRSAGDDIKRLAAALPPAVKIATVNGRYYAMDRDKRWERVSKAYAAIVAADAPRFATAEAVVADSYAHDKSDEFVLPAVVGDYAGMRDGDGILCFNFRADRVREILLALLDPKFSGFPRVRTVKIAAAIGMMPYSEELDALMGAIFLHDDLTQVLGEIAADAGRTQ